MTGGDEILAAIGFVLLICCWLFYLFGFARGYERALKDAAQRAKGEG